jgi:hypothetical protein
MKKGVKLLPLREGWDGCCGVDEVGMYEMKNRGSINRFRSAAE